MNINNKLMEKAINKYFNPLEDKINNINKYIPNYSGKVVDIFKDSDDNIIITYEATPKTHGMLSTRLINNKTIIGHVDHNELNNDTYTIIYIFINKDYRRRGYATKLLKYVIRYGLNNGFKKFRLTSENKNSDNFYENMGMRKVGVGDYNLNVFEFNETEAQKFINT